MVSFPVIAVLTLLSSDKPGNISGVRVSACPARAGIRNTVDAVTNESSISILTMGQGGQVGRTSPDVKSCAKENYQGGLRDAATD